MSRTIILSYGLQDRLRSSLDRARRFGTPIHVVPAIPSAVRGLRRHRSSLVTVHEQVGRAGLDAALGDDDTVLLLHEDVLLSPDGAKRLLEVAASTASVVAPRTNHADVDGATGTLPPDVVQPLGPPEPPQPVNRVRNVCLAGRAGQLRRLLRQRLTGASTRLYAGGGILLVPDVVATHLDEGRDQLEPATGPDGRPLLVAAMIVRDEEDFLADCLASLEGLVDRIEIYDTGSTDGTVELAEAAGAHVVRGEWRDDFAWARNQVLEQCRDASWVLHVDADERVRTADPVMFRRFLATALPDAEGFDVPLNNIGTDGSDLGGQQLPRIFPADDTVYFGRVHEVPHHPDGSMLAWTVTTDLEIEHLGYRPDVVRDRDKRRRNLDLARADHATVGDTRSKLQLARALGAYGGVHDEVLEVTGELLDLVRAGEDGLNEAGRIPVYQLHSRALFQTGDTDGAWETISEGLDAYPHSSLLRAVFGEIGNRTGHAAEVAARLGGDVVEEGARPWSDTMAETTEAVQLAVSQLASDDLGAAAATIGDVLAAGVPQGFDRWGDIVAVTALSRPDDAVDLLLPAAAADASGVALAAVADVLDPADAAAFVVAACREADGPSPMQRDVALARAAVADDPAAVATLVDLAAVEVSHVARVVDRAGPRVAAWFADAYPAPTTFDLDAALDELLDGGRTDEEALVLHLAEDATGVGLRTLARRLPAEVAAPLAARAVVDGAQGPQALRTALATITIADDAEAAAAIVPHLQEVGTDLLDTLLTRAASRGSMAVVGVLSRALLARAGHGTS